MADATPGRSRRRRTGLALAALGLLLVGLVVFLVRRGSDGVEGGPAPAPAPAGDRPPAELAGTRAAPAPSDAARTGPGTPDAEPAAGPRDEPQDPAQRPFDAGSGPVEIAVRFVGDGPRPRVVELVVWPRGDEDNARWLRLDGADPKGRLPRAPSYTIHVNVDDCASDQRFGEMAPDANDRIVLDVALLVRPILEIVDAARGAPIADAFVDAVDSSESDDADAPGWLGSPRAAGDRLRTRIAADAGGRVTLDPTTKESVVWVGAPGHAWVRKRVAFTAEPQRVVLAPGGAVRVVVERYERLADARIAVARIDSSVAGTPSANQAFTWRRGVEVEPTAVVGTFVLGGLSPGTWLATVAPRSADEDAKALLAQQVFVVMAGQTTDVALSPTDAPKPVEVGIVLEFRIASRADMPMTWELWGQGRDNGDVDRVLRVPPPDGAGVTRVPVTGLRLGPYQLQDRSTGWDRLVVVREPDQVVPVVMPASGGLRVRVLAGADRRVLSDADVRLMNYESPWGPLDAADGDRQGGATSDATRGTPGATPDPAFEVRGWRGGGIHVPWDAEVRAYAARVVSGKVSVSAAARGFVEQTVDTTITPGDAVRELEIVLDRGATVIARVTQGGKSAPHLVGTIGVSVPTSPTGEGGAGTYHYDVSTATVDGLAPGTYEVTWRREEGDTPVKTTVTVAAGATVTVDLEVK